MRRAAITQTIVAAFEVTPCVAILGPRQCGKTTQARLIAKQRGIPAQNYFDLEKPADRERLKDPFLALTPLCGLIVIDEVQLMPDLFASLRVLIDDPDREQQYLILGSASRTLIQHSSETLAGRLSYIELTPFYFGETSVDDPEGQKLWLRGGFPLAYLAKTDAISFAWRQAYIKTYLEQDIPQLGIRMPPENLRRFWMMLAHAQGSTFNASDMGRSLGLTNKMVQHYLDILTGTFMVRALKPWFENVSKRQVKAPKVYIRDAGILHTLLSIHAIDDLLMHPAIGASWESFVLEQIIILSGADPLDCYYWSTHQGAELDLLIHHRGQRWGFEIKRTSAPQLTKSMHIAMQDLKLTHLFVVYPGTIDYPLGPTVDAIGFLNIGVHIGLKMQH